MLGGEIILSPAQGENQAFKEGMCFPRPAHLTSWWSWNSEPGVKSSNPGFKVSICCFYNLEKAKKKNFKEKTTHQKKLYIKWSNMWLI